MAKIQRQTQKIFGSGAGNDQLAAFGTMAGGSPIYTDDIETLQTSAYEQGWSSAVAANNAPFMEEMNGVQYGLSKQIAYLFQAGIPEWDEGTVYYANSYCQINGNIYQSKTDNNAGHNPTDADTEYWKEGFNFTSDYLDTQIAFDGTGVYLESAGDDTTPAASITITGKGIQINDYDVLTNADVYFKDEVDDLLDTKVSKSGDTMTGQLAFDNNTLTAISINLDRTIGSVGENLQDITYMLDNVRRGLIRCNHNTSDQNILHLGICDNNGDIKGEMVISCDADGNVTTKAVTPATTSNSIDIATTAWVRTKINSAVTYNSSTRTLTIGV